MDEILIYQGDCLEVMKTLPDNSVDSIVTDPPYELGFMGKKWDSTGIANNKEMWTEALRVLKSGGYLLSFGGTRTYHRMACAIEDSGFEIRDMISWIYGSGFPKSLNIGKAIDKLQGNEREKIDDPEAGRRNKTVSKFADTYGSIEDKTDFVTKGTSEWEGWGTALKPACEPCVLARKPLSEKTVAENVLKWGTGGINIDGSRVEIDTNDANHRNPLNSKSYGTTFGSDTPIASNQIQRMVNGRFPANLIHDGSDEVLAVFPNTKSGKMGAKNIRHTDGSPNGIYGKFDINHPLGETYGDESSASRFFYCAKTSKSERNKGCEGLELKAGGSNAKGYTKDVARGLDRNRPVANNHPTVKPIALMKYLIKLITPPNGIVLDPFAGSGSTLVAAKELGFNYIGIEKEPEYIKICEARINATQLFNGTLFQ